MLHVVPNFVFCDSVNLFVKCVAGYVFCPTYHNGVEGCISLLCYSVSCCSATMPYRGFLYYSRAGQHADLEESVCGPCSPEYFQKLILTNYITGGRT